MQDYSLQQKELDTESFFRSIGLTSVPDSVNIRNRLINLFQTLYHSIAFLVDNDEFNKAQEFIKLAIEEYSVNEQLEFPLSETMDSNLSNINPSSSFQCSTLNQVSKNDLQIFEAKIKAFIDTV